MGCKIWDNFCISEGKKFFETNPQLSLTLIFIFYRRSHLTYMFLLGILTKIVIIFAAGFVDRSGFNLSLTSCALSTSFSFGVWIIMCFGSEALNSVDILRPNEIVLIIKGYPEVQFFWSVLGKQGS